MLRAKRPRFQTSSSPTDPLTSAQQSQNHLNADLAPGLVLSKDNNSNFGTIELNGGGGTSNGGNGSKSPPQRFSIMDSSQTEKNILNINPVKYKQSEALPLS